MSNEATQKLMARAQAGRGDLVQMPRERPVPTKQYNTRMNDDARRALADMSHSLNGEGHTGYEYHVIDALTLALDNPAHREYVRHLLGLRGKLQPEELSQLP